MVCVILVYNTNIIYIVFKNISFFIKLKGLVLYLHIYQTNTTFLKIISIQFTQYFQRKTPKF